MIKYVCLEWWSWALLRVHLNTCTSHINIAVLPCKHKIQGRAWRCNGVWYIVRADNCGNIVFQINTQIYYLHMATKLEVIHKQTKSLFIFEYENLYIEVEYKSPCNRMWNKQDVAYDGVDEEIDDFFVMITSVWKNKELYYSLCNVWAAP